MYTSKCLSEVNCEELSSVIITEDNSQNLGILELEEMANRCVKHTVPALILAYKFDMMLFCRACPITGTGLVILQDTHMDFQNT